MRLNLRRLLAPVLSFLGIAFSAGSALSQEPAPSLPPNGNAVSGTPIGGMPVMGMPVTGGPVVMDNGNNNGSDRGGFVGGLGVYFMKPYFDSNRAINYTRVPNPGVVINSSSDFSYDTSVSPRAWLGYVGCDGWGVRASGWFFDQGSSESASLTLADAFKGNAIVSAAPGGLAVGTPPGTFLFGTTGTDVLNVHSRLRADVIDLEATKAFDVGRSMLLVTAGARLAWFEHDYSASLTNTSNNPKTVSVSQFLAQEQRYTGGGPTISFQGHCPLGDSGLGLYGIARGALIAGENTNDTTFTNAVTIANAPVKLPSFANSSPHNVLVPMGEIELGGEWNGNTGRFNPLLRVGVIAHSYGNLFSNNSPTNSGPNGNLSFLGFTVAAGIRY